MSQDAAPVFLENYFAEDDLRLIRERLEGVEQRCAKRIAFSIIKSNRCDAWERVMIETQRQGWEYEKPRFKDIHVLFILILDDKKFTILYKEDALIGHKDLIVLEKEMNSCFRGGAYLSSVLFGIKKIGEQLILAQGAKGLLEGIEEVVKLKEEARALYQKLPSFIESIAEHLPKSKNRSTHYQAIENAKNIFTNGVALMEQKEVDWRSVHANFKNANRLLLETFTDIVNS